MSFSSGASSITFTTAVLSELMDSHDMATLSVYLSLMVRIRAALRVPASSQRQVDPEIRDRSRSALALVGRYFSTASVGNGSSIPVRKTSHR